MPSLPDPPNGGETSWTPFRQAEKHFKNRSTPRFPSLHGRGVLDLSRPELEGDDEVWLAGWWCPDESDGDSHSHSLGNARRRRMRAWKGKERDRGERPETSLDGLRRLELSDGREAWVVAEGCILIPKYLSPEDQLSLSQSALEEYTRPPNPLSLSTHYILPGTPPHLFEQYATEDPTSIYPRYNALDPEQQSRVDLALTHGGSRRTIDTLPGSVLGYEEIVQKNKGWKGDVPSGKLGEKNAEKLMRELRWANLGWVYQWSTKSYDFTPEQPITFPPDLAELCTAVVRKVPWAEVFNRSHSTEPGSSAIPPPETSECSTTNESARPDFSTWKEDYAPDTGIVNFYQLNDTLMAHVDRAELDPSRPLVSISLGHAAIFLLGSASRQEPPLPIILRSGDVLIMSGKGRQSYHGVPRIMEGALPAHFIPAETDDASMSATKRFMSTARININARQVFPPGFKRPDRDA